MKMVKSLILGSAAGLVALSGAQAADLPVKAKAVEYVRICSLYGAGFFYIPGTDTCIKLGGYMRIDSTFNGGIYDQPAWSGDLGVGDRTRDNINSRSRMALTIDTRTATEYGVVRTFGQGDFQFNNFGNSNPAAIGNSAAAPVVASTQGLLSGSFLDGPGGGYVGVEMVFLQFAGFTFGKSASAYATPWHGYPGNNTSYLIGGHDTVTGVDNIQYTAQFGNGVSATVGLDDPTVFNRTSVYNLSTGLSAAGTGADTYAGFRMPDVVANIRVDQAWGLFQLSGALHEVSSSYNTLGAGGVLTAASVLSGHPQTKYGGSVMAAINIKNIPTGAGDDIKFDASYAVGDTKNVISTSAATPNFLMLGGVTGQLGPNNTIGFGAPTDAIYLPGPLGDGQLKLTTSYGVRGAFNHNWDPYWSSSLFGGFGWVKYQGNSTDLANGVVSAMSEYCGVYLLSNLGALAATAAGAMTCNPNFSVGMLGVVTRWTPVKNLTFSAEALWMHLNTSMSGTAVLAVGTGQPTQAYTYHGQDTVSFNVRAQRNF